MSLLDWLLEGSFTVGSSAILLREVVGNGFQLAVLAVVGTTVFFFVLDAIGSWGPLPDAWIVTGSILATYAMARGWIEFWLIWVAVDVVGVPLLLRADYYPSAVLYLLYGAFCVWGFWTWVQVRRTAERADDIDVPQEVAA